MTDAVLDVPLTRGWLGRLARIPAIFGDPAEVFDQEARGPNALIPILVLIVGFSSLLFLYAGLMVDLALSAVPLGARADVAPSIAAMVESNKWIGVALTPLYIVGWVLTIGMVIFVMISVFPGRETDEGGLHRAMSVGAYAYLAILLEELVSYVALMAIGFEQVRYSWDLKPLPGLHYLISNPEESGLAFAVLQQFNLFTIAYGILIGYGTFRVFGTSRSVAVTTALLAVAVKVGVVALIAALKP